MLDFARLAAGSRVLEVGSGSGKATTLFASRGVPVLGLEPSAEMAAVCAQRCAQYADVTIRRVSFEDSELESGGFGLLISAQAWHWVTPEVRLARAHDALAARGAIALFWNRPRWTDSAIRTALEFVYQRLAPDLAAREPGFPGLGRTERLLALETTAARRALADGVAELEASPLFDDMVGHEHRRRETYSADRYVALLRTQSDHRMLPEAQRDELLTAVGDVIRGDGGELGVDDVAELYLARRVG